MTAEETSMPRIGDVVLYETGVYTVVARGLSDGAGTYTLSLNREAPLGIGAGQLVGRACWRRS